MNGRPKTDIQRLQTHFGADWRNHDVSELPARQHNATVGDIGAFGLYWPWDPKEKVEARKAKVEAAQHTWEIKYTAGMIGLSLAIIGLSIVMAKRGR